MSTDKPKPDSQTEDSPPMNEIDNGPGKNGYQ